MNSKKENMEYSEEILCQQLKALYRELIKRKREIQADPDLNPGNDLLNDELESIYRKTVLLQECFEQFCPN